MRKRHFVGVAALVGCAAAFFFVGDSSLAQVVKGKTRPMATKQWMKGVNGPSCDFLKKGLDAGPQDDKAWEELAINAALINEGSYILMDDGRCPDAVWAKAASETLRQGSAKVLKAIEERKLDEAKAAFGEMTQACGACHKEHKGKKKEAVKL